MKRYGQMKWKTISSDRALDSPWMSIRKDVVELPNGELICDYYVWESCDIALIVPLTESGRFILVEQYKHATGEITLEFPGGVIETAEPAEHAAKRELREETGYSVRDCKRLAKICDNPTKSTGNLHIFLGTGAQKTTEPQLDISEDISAVSLSRQEVIASIQSGRIRVSGSIAAAFLAFEEIGTKCNTNANR